MRELADEGRTVLLSSHLMSEMEQTADHLVIIGRGRLIADASMQEVMRGEGAQRQVRVRTPSTDDLAGALLRRGLHAHPTDDGDLLVEGATAETVGDIALEVGVAVHRLARGAQLARAGLPRPHRGQRPVPGLDHARAGGAAMTAVAVRTQEPGHR